MQPKVLLAIFVMLAATKDLAATPDDDGPDVAIPDGVEIDPDKVSLLLEAIKDSVTFATTAEDRSATSDADSLEAAIKKALILEIDPNKVSGILEAIKGSVTFETTAEDLSATSDVDSLEAAIKKALKLEIKPEEITSLLEAIKDSATLKIAPEKLADLVDASKSPAVDTHNLLALKKDTSDKNPADGGYVFCEQLKSRLSRQALSSEGCRNHRVDPKKMTITPGDTCYKNPQEKVLFTVSKDIPSTAGSMLTCKYLVSATVGSKTEAAYTMEDDCSLKTARQTPPVKALIDQAIYDLNKKTYTLVPMPPFNHCPTISLPYVAPSLTEHCQELQRRLNNLLTTELPFKVQRCPSYDKDNSKKMVTLKNGCLNDPKKGVVLTFIPTGGCKHDVQTELVGYSKQISHSMLYCSFFNTGNSHGILVMPKDNACPGWSFTKKT